MPEGPECHVIAWTLGQHCADRHLAEIKVHNGRYIKPAELARSGITEMNAALAGAPVSITGVGAKGKLVYAPFANGWGVLSTMGLTGSWTDRRTANCGVSLILHNAAGGVKTLWFADQLHYGTIKFVSQQALETKLRSLGPDVVRADQCTQEWWRALCKRKGGWTLPKLLLEQSQIAGVGNYLKAEALYQARVSPLVQIKECSEAELDAVLAAVLDVTARCYAWKAYKARVPGHEATAPRFLLKVYNKGLDPHRNKVIKTKTTDGRTTHWVPDVQTLPARAHPTAT